MKVFLFGLIFSFVTLNLAAQTKTPAVFRFLEIPSEARSAALGGAHPGLFDGGTGAYHLNPAYLAGSRRGDASAAFVNYFADSRMGAVNASLAADSDQVFGFGLRYMGYGNFSLLDEEGRNLGGLNALDAALSAGYARRLSDTWSTGAELNLIYSSYGVYKSSGLAGTAGLYYRNPEAHFSFGVVIRNLGAQLATYNGTREPLPLDIAVGIAKKPEHFPAEFSFSLRQLNNFDMRRPGETEPAGFTDNLMRHVLGGVRIFFGENFEVRAGYNHFLHELNKLRSNFDLAGTSLGIGLKIGEFDIDMSRISYSKAGGVLMLGLKTNVLRKKQ